MGIFNRHRHLRPEILSEYLDGRLDQRHQELVARRLAGCPACREELNTLQATVSALQNLPDLPLPRSFTLPIAPSPDYPANLTRAPAPPAPLIMKLPGWAYGGAASLAGLALALMLSAEASGLASPASFQATAAPPGAAVAKEPQIEAQIKAKVEAPAAAPVGSQATTPPQVAQRAAQAPAPEAAAETGDSALAAQSQGEPADPALEMAMAMAESQGAAESGSDAATKDAAAKSAAAPPTQEALAFSGTPSDAGTPSDVGTPSGDPTSALEESSPATPADSAPSLVMEPETPQENLSFAVEQSSPPSSPTWWRALETMLAALTLAFLGGLFFRWRRNRSQSDA